MRVDGASRRPPMSARGCMARARKGTAGAPTARPVTGRSPIGTSLGFALAVRREGGCDTTHVASRSGSGSVGCRLPFALVIPYPRHPRRTTLSAAADLCFGNDATSSKGVKLVDSSKCSRSLIKRSFPGHDSLIDRAYRENESFRDLCHDYCNCALALERWRRLIGVDPSSRNREYLELLAELAEEVESWLGAMETGAEPQHQGGPT